MKTLVVTRPVEQAEGTIEALKDRGYMVLHAPITKAVPISFDQTDGDRALIVTSQNGVKHGIATLDERTQLVYAVGKRTGDAARAAGFINVKDGPGNANAMLGMLLELSQEHGVAFSHYCGEDLALNLVERLKAEGADAEMVVAYRMETATSLPESVVKALQNEDVDGVVFHSARTAQAFEELVSELGLTTTLMSVNAYCFSSRIETELLAPWKTKSHAIIPDERTLFDLIDRRIDKRDFEP